MRFLILYIHTYLFSFDQHQQSGIFGSGFEEQISRRRKIDSIPNDNIQTDDPVGSDWEIVEVVGDEGTFRGRVYNFIHLQISQTSKHFDTFVSVLVIGTSLTFMLDTVTSTFVTPSAHKAFDIFELGSVIIFTIGEYSLVVIRLGAAFVFLTYLILFVTI